MRLAILSDIHGNPMALDTVLADIEAQGGIDGYWVLGDLAAIGYDPIGALERLTALPNVRFVRGNTDRYVVSGERPGPDLADVGSNPQLLKLVVQIANSFAWTQGYLSAGGWLDFLAQLPLEQHLVLPDGTRLLGVHAAPGTDDGHGLHPGLSDAQLEAMIGDCQADLICAGHTHDPMDRTVDGARVINLGSVSNPMMPDLRASYVLLEADRNGYRAQHRWVSYDLEEVIQAVTRSKHPAGDFISGHFQGLRQPAWKQHHP